MTPHVLPGRRLPDLRTASILRRLLGSPVNAAITLALLAVAIFLLRPLLRWAVVDATWTGTASDCSANGGACWAFIAEKARFILFGLYPHSLAWQPAAAAALIVGLTVVTALPRFWSVRLLMLWPVAILAALGIMAGFLTGNPVSTDVWGGLPLTLLLAVGGFAGAFPIGIALALGRRSNLGLVRVSCVGIIEVLRGVPMIAVLYVSTLLVPLMLPAGFAIDKLLRAQAAIILFVAAYMAEIVRAGLQAIPPGQYEASRALGLSWWQAMRLVVLPQALRIVIPAFVTLGIGLFLDTTLVIVIGLFDFLNTARTAAVDPNWLGFYGEAYAFVAIIYFATSFGMSRYSLWLERRLRSSRERR